jgi:serine/threonine-protein kinase
MVMEFVRGETLDNVIRQRGAMRCDQAVELFCMALEGIDHAHKMGIIHRDIKPANMMLTETGSIKVMDFGIARVLGTDRLTKTGHLIGTVEYMSPEQVRGEETDARSDIYSLGTLLYEMLTGRVPFNSTSEYELMRSQIEDAPPPPRAFAPLIPLSVEQAIMRSLAKKREARFQSASEFRAMLMMDKSTGAVVKTDPGPASYLTRASETVSDAVAYGQVIKETRLADDGAAMPGAFGSQLKETRLAPDAGAPLGYQQSSPAYSSVQPQAGGSLGALLGKLNWKHYAGAAAVLVALIAVPLALTGGGDKPTPSQPPANVQPSPSAPPPAPVSAPVQSVVPSSSQPTVPQPASPVLAAPVDQGSSVSGPGNTRSTRSRTGSGKPAQADAPPSTQTAEKKPSSESKEERAATPKPADSNENRAKKTKAEKVGDAAEAVVKKFGGLFGKKKNR